MAPFAAALEIHHELAAADHDGHEHSDTDLCQWVQYHTGHSLVGDVPCNLLVLGGCSTAFYLPVDPQFSVSRDRPEPRAHRLGPNLKPRLLSWLYVCRGALWHCAGLLPGRGVIEGGSYGVVGQNCVSVCLALFLGAVCPGR